MSSLLLLIIPIVAIAAIAAIGPLVTRRLNMKVNFYIILGFPVILVVLSVICILIPPSALQTPADPEKITKYFDNGETLIGAEIRAGSFNAPEGFIKTESAFDIQAEHVTILRDPNMTSVYVGIKGVDAPDNGNKKVDIVTFMSGIASFNDSGYYIAIEPLKCVFDNGVHPTLSFVGNDMKAVDFYHFDDRYALPQFFGGNMSSSGMGVTTCQIVVVLLPPGVTYSGDGTAPLASLGAPNQ